MLLEILLIASVSHAAGTQASPAVLTTPYQPGQHQDLVPASNGCTQLGGGQATVNQLKASGYSCQTTSFGWHCEKIVMGRLRCYDVYP